MVITNPASAPEIIISMSVVHEEDVANQTYGPIEIHSDGITRILPRVDFNAGLNLQSNSNEKKHDAKAIIAQRNAMIKGLYEELQ